MYIKCYHACNPAKSGYIAGDEDGIVTAGGEPSAQVVYLFECQTGNCAPILVQRQVSLPNGNYCFMHLDPDKEYLIMATDHNKDYEPFALDYVKPVTDKTFAEQQEMWESWR